jgi:hypothetical protein
MPGRNSQVFKSSRDAMVRASLCVGSILALVFAAVLASGDPDVGNCEFTQSPIARCTTHTGWTYNGDGLIYCCYAELCTDDAGKTWTGKLKQQTRPTYYKDDGGQRQWCFDDATGGWTFVRCCGVIQNPP